VKADDARFSGAAPEIYQSSHGVERLFCGRCGTPVAYRSARFAGEIHFYAAALDDPTRAVPQFHVHWAEKLPWVEISDSLPRYPGSSVS